MVIGLLSKLGDSSVRVIGTCIQTGVKDKIEWLPYFGACGNIGMSKHGKT